MKFEYDGDVGEKECVAFIDDEGDLWVKTGEGSVVFFQSKMEPSQGVLWLEEKSTHKFYPGDKITITF